jgi:thiosulfate/3-mercaptopyruvate sulfurtransferase
VATPLLPTPLVTPAWLAAHLGAPDLVVLDASMKPIGSVGASPAASAEVWLPRAQVFDFDTRVCDRSTSLPHMMPTPEVFEREVRALGVNQQSQIVVYDKVGIFSSPRAWWMFKAMGHDAVAVLDGGLPGWVAAGLPTESGSRPAVATGDFVARPRSSLFVDADDVATALTNPAVAVLDARSEGRFHGRDPEPRQGLRGGHMPNAINVPFGAVQAQGRMKSAEEIAALFAAKVGARERLVFSCGSGVTACTLALAAELAGYSNKAVYDGSWSEWGLPSARPVVTE